MATRHERDFQLRADTVSARHQHRLAIALAIQREQTAERSDVRQDTRRECRPRERSDAANSFVAGVDVHAGVPIVDHRFSLASAARMPACSQPRSLLLMDCRSRFLRISSRASRLTTSCGSAARAMSARYSARTGSVRDSSRARAATFAAPPASLTISPYAAAGVPNIDDALPSNHPA